MSTETFYIYEIFNIVTQKRYIGMTQSIQRRCMAHLADIRARRHTAEGIVADYIKYGEESFQFKVIDFASTKDEAKAKEGKYMRKFNSYNPDFGYNGRDNRFLNNKHVPSCSHTELAKLISEQGYKLKDVAHHLNMNCREFSVRANNPALFTEQEVEQMNQLLKVHRRKRGIILGGCICILSQAI